MARWLVKEEPTHYSFERFARDGSTQWSGVHNPLAQRHLRLMRPRESGFYYHSGTVRAIVGTFRVASRPELDPEDPRGAYRVRLEAGEALPFPVTLRAIKSDGAFREFALVRIPRLSVMPVSAAYWTRILALSRSQSGT